MLSNQGLEHQNNSAENLFNLIQATKTKNTPMLEPLNKVSHKKNDSNNGSAFGDAGFISPKDEIGIGLKKSNRMQQTEYGHGFNSIPGPETQDQQLPAESPSKVFRSWSRPQISHAHMKQEGQGQGSLFSNEKPI